MVEILIRFLSLSQESQGERLLGGEGERERDFGMWDFQRD